MDLIPKPIKGAKRTIVILSMALAGCRGPLPAASPTPDALSVHLLADSTTAPLLRELVSHYRPADPLIAWDIRTADGDRLLRLLHEGQAPFALVSHIDTQDDSLNGLWQTPVGLAGVAFVVHPSNPVGELDARTIRAILQGQIDAWDELGGAAQPITVVARAAETSDAALIQQMVLGDRRTTREALLAVTPSMVVELVASNPNAFGYVTVGYVTEAVRMVPVDGLLPTAEMLGTEQYPIRAPIAFVGMHPPENDIYRAFFAWVQSPEGQAVVSQHHFGPLPQQVFQ